MSDIQEEQKRLYKRAEENDKKILEKELEELRNIFNYEKDLRIKSEKEINRLNNIIKNLDKMFEYYFLGNLKYDQDTVNTIYIKYVKLKELKGDNK